MKWNKIRKELLDRLSENLKGRLDYHLTSYKNSTGFIGRAWITLDGEQIVNFSNQDTFTKFDSYSNSSVGTGYITHEPISDTERTNGNLIEKGEFSKYDFGHTAWEFINLDVNVAIVSNNVILRSLAVVDRRVGLKRLKELRVNENHPLVLKLIDLREHSA